MKGFMYICLNFFCEKLSQLHSPPPKKKEKKHHNLKILLKLFIKVRCVVSFSDTKEKETNRESQKYLKSHQNKATQTHQEYWTASKSDTVKPKSCNFIYYSIHSLISSHDFVA